MGIGANFIKTLLLVSFLGQLVESKRVGPCLKNVMGTHCIQPGATWQNDGVCIILPNKRPGCHIQEIRHFKFTLVARVKQRNAEIIDSLWVRGSGPGLSWEKSAPMKKSGRDIGNFNIDLSYTSDSNAILCFNSSYCSLNQKALELRFYTDKAATMDMEGPNIYVPLPVSNSMSDTYGFIPPRVEVFPWFKNSRVRTSTFTMKFVSYIRIRLSAHAPGQQITIASTIVYPPSFDYNIHKKYPLVIIFGAEAIHITRLLETMYTKEATIKESVVVSVHNLDPAPFCLFNPFNNIVSMPGEMNSIWACNEKYHNCDTTCFNCWDKSRRKGCLPGEFLDKARQCRGIYRKLCSGYGEDLLDFVQDKLVNKLHKMTEGRIEVDFPRERMTAVGFSGGGLLAYYAVLSRPMYYESAACLSAQFHWPMGYDLSIADRKNEGLGLLMRELNTTLAIHPAYKGLYTTQKYYIDIGERDEFYLPIVNTENYAQWAIDQLGTVGVRPENILYFKVPKGSNSYYHIRDGGTELFKRIKQPLLFLFKAEGGPNAKYPRLLKVSDATYVERQGEIGMKAEDLDKLIEEEENKTEKNLQGLSCLNDNRYKIQHAHPGIPAPAFIVCISLSILFSVGVTAGFMLLREANRKAKEKDKKEEELFGSDLSDLELPAAEDSLKELDQ